MKIYKSCYVNEEKQRNDLLYTDLTPVGEKWQITIYYEDYELLPVYLFATYEKGEKKDFNKLKEFYYEELKKIQRKFLNDLKKEVENLNIELKNNLVINGLFNDQTHEDEILKQELDLNLDVINGRKNRE